MGDVEVSAGHNRLLLGKLAQKGTVALVPDQPLVQACELVLGVGRVDVHEPVRGKLERADAALVIGRLAANLPHHLQGLLA